MLGFDFRVYPIDVVVNGRRLRRAIISTHYEQRHKESVNDFLILEMLHKLNGQNFLPDATDDGFEYFVSDPVIIAEKPYRLVWLLPRDDSYIGVRTAFRRKRG